MRPFSHLVLPDLFLAEVIGHARAELPYECCGLLAGYILDGIGVVTERFAIFNDAASPTEYLSNAEDMLAAFRAMRRANLELLAIYHSHPASHPVPSASDVEKNTYGDSVVHLIVGFGGEAPEVRAWWFRWNEAYPAAWSTA
jgi:proteasome lid subunit RPN8/RPN11